MVEVIDLKNYQESVTRLLDRLDFSRTLEQVDKILIKPNLLEDVPPPCTTHKDCVAAIIEYIRNCKPGAEVAVIEGSGGCDTQKAFKALGYERLKEKYGIRLIDVDRCQLVKKFNDNALAYRQVYLPRVLFENYYFISVPVLKAHTITRVTLSYKNLIGLLAQKHYGGYWHYRRSDVHRVGVEKAIYDLSNYVPIDLAIIDAATGQADSHLRGGKACNPPHRKIVGGHRIVEVDQAGCRLLGVDPETVRHLSLIEKTLI